MPVDIGKDSHRHAGRQIILFVVLFLLSNYFVYGADELPPSAWCGITRACPPPGEGIQRSHYIHVPEEGWNSDECFGVTGDGETYPINIDCCLGPPILGTGSTDDKLKALKDRCGDAYTPVSTTP
ncbi:MAG: hypothetical protein MUC52_03520, partial [Candidatus Omnitrophica bacterium]|nr:hypothetical protein [Candidatus Omnitrophota bacterium]